MSDGNDLVRTYCRICELDPPATTLGPDVDRPDPAVLRLIDLGALRHTGNRGSVVCLECDEPHEVAVEMADDGSYRAYCRDAGYFIVPVDALKLYSFDIGWIVAKLGHRIGVAPSHLIEGALWDLGEVGLPGRTTNVSVWFGRRLSDLRVWRDVRGRHRARPPRGERILLSSTTSDRISDWDAGLRIVSLEDVLRHAVDGRIDLRLLSDLLDGVQTPADAGRPEIIAEGREVRFRGEVYHFPRGAVQRRIVVKLAEYARNGERHVASAKIVSDLDLGEHTRMRDVFKDSPAWKTLLDEKVGMLGFCYESGSEPSE